MRLLPPKDERHPAWEVLQVFFGVVIAILTWMSYVSDVQSWKLFAFMLALWGGVALTTLRKPQWMILAEERERAKITARIMRDWYRNNQGDGI